MYCIGIASHGTQWSVVLSDNQKTWAQKAPQTPNIITTQNQNLLHLQEDLRSEALIEVMLELLSSQGLSFKDIKQLALVEGLHKNIFLRAWNQRQWHQWLEDQGLDHIELSWIAPRQALTLAQLSQLEGATAHLLCLGLEGEGLPAQALVTREGHTRLLAESGDQPLLCHWLQELVQFCGFEVNEKGYSQFMNFASYGEPRFVDLFYEKWVSGENQNFLALKGPNKNWQAQFKKAFKLEPRDSEAPVTSFEMDISCSLTHLLRRQIRGTLSLLKKEAFSETLSLVGEGYLLHWFKEELPSLSPYRQVLQLPGPLAANLAIGAQLALKKLETEALYPQAEVSASGHQMEPVG